MTHSAATPYHERLAAPWWLWLAGAALAATLGIAYAAPFAAAIGLLVFAVTMAIIAVALLRSAPVVDVSDGMLHAGVAVLPLHHVGAVTPLDAEAATRLRGSDADPFAWMLLRGWIPTAVRIDVDDPDDDTPYWYVSTRHPHTLALALTGGGSPGDRDGPAGAQRSDASG